MGRAAGEPIQTLHPQQVNLVEGESYLCVNMTRVNDTILYLAVLSFTSTSHVPALVAHGSSG